MEPRYDPRFVCASRCGAVEKKQSSLPASRIETTRETAAAIRQLSIVKIH
jgi:hypothetical protein